MAKIRIGLGSEFNLKDGNLGLGVANPQARLDVDGTVKSNDLEVTGVTSFTAYEGFLRSDHQIDGNLTLNTGQGLNASLSGEIIVKTGQTVTINDVVKDTAGVGVGTNPQWRNLVNTGDARIATGNFPVWNGNSFVFNKNGGFKVDNYSETFETSITVEWWGTSDYPAAMDYAVPVVRTSSSSWDDGFGFYQRNGSVFWWVNAWNGAQKAEIAATSFGMTHWVGTYDGSNLKLYRNGSLVDTGSSFTANITEPSNGLLIGMGGGNDSSNDYYWDGTIPIVRIYSTALTAAQINAQFKLGPTSLLTVVEPDAAHFNANNPLSFPGKVSTVDTAEVNLAGGSEIECLKVYNTFTPPSGGTNERPYAPKPGELYYNYDLKTIEFHDGYGWRQVDNTTTTGRMLISGGYVAATSKLIDYVNISTTGNAVNFAELDAAQYDNGGCANSIRGLSAGNSPYADVIEYVTMASGGNGLDFGNLTQGRRLSHSGMANSNRGVFAGGKIPASPNFTNIIDTVNIMTIGNAVDFGDMSLHRDASAFVFASPTRGLFGGGKNTDGVDFSSVELINISSGGDSTQFPEIITAREQGSGSCNQTKGVFAGGQSGPTVVNNIESIIISSLGNSVDFGNLTISVRQLMSAGSHTRGVFAGGKDPSNHSTISYVNISSSGDALDFGDLTVARHAGTAFSDCHGGLGGF